MFLAALFALAHTQSPLFFSNQNQYLLHGLAHAGHGRLDQDWLANSKDPTPAFSFLVEALDRAGGLFSIEAAFFGLLMVYFLGAWRLAESLGNPPLLAFAAIFTGAHAAIFRFASVRLFGVDYPWYFQAGVAGQYLLGPGLQPSAFGVLLLLSLAAWGRGRPRLAAVFAALAADVHATYLLPAAFLTLGYSAALIRSNRKLALAVGIIALVAVAPMLAYVFVQFSASWETVRESQHILATIRIPHHSQISKWLDGVALLQIAWVGAGLFLLRRTTFFVPLVVAAIGGAVLSLLQFATGSDALALLFPWRITALLVPIATAAVAARLARFDSPSRTSSGLVPILAFGLLALQAVGGIAIMSLRIGYRMNEAEEPLLQHVRETAGPGDVYLIPTRIPPVGTGKRGIISTSFTPPPRPRPGSNLIPVDLQRFRLATGAPIYVDFKSVPYAPTEVLEWLRRVKQAEGWYGGVWDRPGIREELIREEVTHVVVPSQRPAFADFLECIYWDSAYLVYRVR